MEDLAQVVVDGVGADEHRRPDLGVGAGRRPRGARRSAPAAVRSGRARAGGACGLVADGLELAAGAVGRRLGAGRARRGRARVELLPGVAAALARRSHSPYSRWARPSSISGRARVPGRRSPRGGAARPPPSDQRARAVRDPAGPRRPVGRAIASSWTYASASRRPPARSGAASTSRASSSGVTCRNGSSIQGLEPVERRS